MHVPHGVDFPILKGTFEVRNGREKLCLHIIHFEILAFIHRPTSVNIFSKSVDAYRYSKYIFLFSSAFLSEEIFCFKQLNSFIAASSVTSLRL